MILDQAFRYITELKKQNDAMLLDGGDKVQGTVVLFIFIPLFRFIPLVASNLQLSSCNI